MSENYELILDSMLNTNKFDKCKRRFVVKCLVSGLDSAVKKLLCPKSPSTYHKSKSDNCLELEDSDLLSNLCKLLILANKSENVCKVLTNIGLVIGKNLNNEFFEEVSSALEILDVCENRFGKSVIIKPNDGNFVDGSNGIYENYAIVGKSNSVNDAMYIFKYVCPNWVQDVKFESPIPGINYGGSNAIYGDFAIVGARFENSNAGAVYVYRLVDGEWSFFQKLVSDDGQVPNELFGESIAIYGNTIVVGAIFDNNEGAAHVYKFNGLQWVREIKLAAIDGGVANSEFGNSVAINGDVIVVGERADDSGQGAAHVYTYNGVSWQNTKKLISGDGRTSGDLFGNNVAVYNDVIVVGVDFDDGNMGSVQVFRYDGSDWIFEKKITTPELSSNQFGISISIYDNTILMGDARDNSQNGAVYVYEYDGSDWINTKKLLGQEEGEQFGFYTSIYKENVFVSLRSGFDNSYIFSCGK
jgi:hypothetical protein